MGKGRGSGIRQRLKKHLTCKKPLAKAKPTPVGKALKSRYVNGRCSANELVSLARAVNSSGGSSSAPDLARIANQNKEPRVRIRKGKPQEDDRHNAKRVHKTLKKDNAKLYESYIISCPCWNAEANKPVMRKLGTLPIHETLEAMVEEGREEDRARGPGPGPGGRG